MQEELDKIKDIDPWGALDIYLGSDLSTELELAWDKQHSKINTDLYYHTCEHMLGVAKIAQYIAHIEGFRDPEELSQLILASLFHDYHHSLGKYPDYINIYRSVINVESVFNKLGITSLIDPVIDLIKSTLYEPGVIYVPSTFLKDILHDADYLYATLTQDPEVILTNLRKEIEVSAGRDITRAEMVQGQLEFQKNAVIATTTGRKLWHEHQPKFIELIK